MTPLTAGRVARRLLAFYRNDPKRWNRGWFAGTASGASTYAQSPAATCFCALGALQKIVNVQDDAPTKVVDRYMEAATVLTQAVGAYSLAHFNDSCPDFTTFQDSLKKIARLP